jgi:hypothetical protein
VLFGGVQGRSALLALAAVEIFRLAFAVVVVALSATENGKTKQLGASFSGTGAMRHVKETEPVKPFFPLAVMVDVPA